MFSWLVACALASLVLVGCGSEGGTDGGGTSVDAGPRPDGTVDATIIGGDAGGPIDAGPSVAFGAAVTPFREILYPGESVSVVDLSRDETGRSLVLASVYPIPDGGVIDAGPRDGAVLLDGGSFDAGPAGSADARVTGDGGIAGRIHYRGGSADTGVRDAGPRDAGRDAGPVSVDAGPRDAGRDAGPPAADTGPRDAGTFDSGPRDSGPRDSGPPDVGPPRDTGTRDSGPRDAGPPDAFEPIDAARVDVGVDAGPSRDAGTPLTLIGIDEDPEGRVVINRIEPWTTTETFRHGVRFEGERFVATTEQILSTNGTSVHRAGLPSESLRFISRPFGDPLDHREALWIATADALLFVVDGVARPVSVDGVPVVVRGMAHDTRNALWVASSTGLLRIAADDTQTGPSIRAGRVPLDEMPTDVGLDDRGSVHWLVGTSPNARWFVMDVTERISEVTVPATTDFIPSSFVSSHAPGLPLWVSGTTRSGQPALAVVSRGQVRPITLAGATLARVTPIASPDGSIVVVTDVGIERWRAFRRIRVTGLAAGSSIRAATRVGIVADAREMATLSARVGTTSLVVASDANGDYVTLDPTDLGIGANTLEVEASYADGSLPATAQLAFVIDRDPTWTLDVREVYDDHCAVCHSVAGRVFTLETRESWEGCFDMCLSGDGILNAVRNQRMPLGGPYLSEDEIRMLEAWQAAGFPE